MERCEGYFRLENRRCERAATHDVRAADGQFYLVCAHHARETRAAAVAHWSGQTDVRKSAPAPILLAARAGLDG